MKGKPGVVLCCVCIVFLVEYLATQTGGATVNNLHTQKLTNFGAVSIVEGVVCGKRDGNIKHSHGQWTSLTHMN